MTLLVPLLVSAVLIGIGFFLLIWAKITLRPDRRWVERGDGTHRASFSMRVTRGLGLVFILGGVFTILGALHIAGYTWTN